MYIGSVVSADDDVGFDVAEHTDSGESAFTALSKFWQCNYLNTSIKTMFSLSYNMRKHGKSSVTFIETVRTAAYGQITHERHDEKLKLQLGKIKILPRGAGNPTGGLP